MLTPRDLRELEVLTARIAKGSVTREDWSNLAALIILSQGAEIAALIAAHGLTEFIRVSGPVYEGHAFRFDDFKRMYDRICVSFLRDRSPAN